MSPSDSHFRQQLALFLPLALCGFTHHQSGSPKFLGALSVRAARLYPGESGGWFQSSFLPPMLASHLLSSLATPIFGFEASSADSLSLRLAPSQARGFSRPVTQPPARSASCVMTLTWLTPFSQREHAKLSWRTRRPRRSRRIDASNGPSSPERLPLECSHPQKKS